MKIFKYIFAITFLFSSLAFADPIYVFQKDDVVNFKQTVNRFFLVIPNPGTGAEMVCGFDIKIPIDGLTQDMLTQISDSMTVEEGFRFNGDERTLEPILGTEAPPALSYNLKFINGENFTTYARFTTKTNETFKAMIARITHKTGYKFRAFINARSCQ